MSESKLEEHPDYCRYCHENLEACKECEEKMKEEEHKHKKCQRFRNEMRCLCKLCKNWSCEVVNDEKHMHDLFREKICCRDECQWHIHQSKHVLSRREIEKRERRHQEFVDSFMPRTIDSVNKSIEKRQKWLDGIRREFLSKK